MKYVEDIDKALLRRFQSQIKIELPTELERLSLMQKFLEEIDINISEEEFLEMSKKTEGWSGSCIEALCRKASSTFFHIFFFFLNTFINIFKI